jgi:CRP-like cAMP-binding protein
VLRRLSSSPARAQDTCAWRGPIGSTRNFCLRLYTLRALAPVPSLVISKEGKEAVVAILGADEFIGEGCLIGQPKRLATAMAMTECEAMKVEKAEIMRVLSEEPAFSKMFLSHVLARSARVEEDLIDQLFNSTEKRLARVLLLMAILARKAGPSRSRRKSAKKPSPR